MYRHYSGCPKLVDASQRCECGVPRVGQKPRTLATRRRSAIKAAERAEYNIRELLYRADLERDYLRKMVVIAAEIEADMIKEKASKALKAREANLSSLKAD